MGVAVEFQQASLGYLSVSGENATQQRHGEASSHLPVSPASPSSTTEREWTSTPRRQFVELGDGRQQQRGERIASPKEIVDHRSGSPFVAGKPGKKVALCRRLLETVVAEDSPSLPEAGEEVTGLGDGAVGPPLLVVTPTREEDRGRRLLLRSVSCYDVRVADDRGMLLHCFAERRRGASASDAIGYATAIAHWIAMLCFANIGAVRRRRSRELRSPALEVTVGSPPL
nr:hypothetical protein Iba_chr04bCG14870 [Ipomoea batatas]